MGSKASEKSVTRTIENRAENIRLYRAIVLAGLLFVIILSFTFPYKPRSIDSWAYYFAIKNFSVGRWVINDELHLQQMQEAIDEDYASIRTFKIPDLPAKAKVRWPVQYVEIDDGKWALEKAPGYPLFVVPFNKVGIPRAANVVLLFGMVFVTYLLLRHMGEEETACIGSLLMMFTPVSLIMFLWGYMAMFAASAFLVIGGGLYLYYILRKGESKWGALILFLAALFMSWSVVARYSNLLVAFIFTLHFVISRMPRIAKGDYTLLKTQVFPFGAGILLSVIVLLAYHGSVFGSPFDHGYNYSIWPTKFAFEYLGEKGPDGESMPFAIIKGNISNMPEPLLLGFPILVLAIPGIAYILWQKGYFARHGSRRRDLHTWPELSGTTILILVAWFLSVFGLYMLYEWTARSNMDEYHPVVLDRFYLPGLFPLVLISSLILARFPRKLSCALLAICIGMGIVLFVQRLAEFDFNSL